MRAAFNGLAEHVEHPDGAAQQKTEKKLTLVQLQLTVELRPKGAEASEKLDNLDSRLQDEKKGSKINFKSKPSSSISLTPE